MVSEEDLIRTVSTAYGNGWRQVKLYFMCGLPTETDEDVLQIGDMAVQVIAEGPQGLPAERHPLHGLHRRLRAQAAHPVPVGPAAQRRGDRRAALDKSADKIRGDKKYGRSIGFRYHDGKPGIVEGLLSRGDRRIGAVIRAVYEDGGRFDGWREYFCTTAGCLRREDAPGVRRGRRWYTTRERTYGGVLPWDHLDSGLDKDWLWEDWQDSLDETEVEDCRWTPCFDCGVCPQFDTGHKEARRARSCCRLTLEK